MSSLFLRLWVESVRHQCLSWRPSALCPSRSVTPCSLPHLLFDQSKIKFSFCYNILTVNKRTFVPSKALLFPPGVSRLHRPTLSPSAASPFSACLQPFLAVTTFLQVLPLPDGLHRVSRLWFLEVHCVLVPSPSLCCKKPNSKAYSIFSKEK